MKKIKYCKESQVLNNQGFSLIELLISIAFLVIIMVPLMNYFIHSMKMNQKADKLETESNMASDIMEGLKNLDMDETVKQFHLSTNLIDFSILPSEMISTENPQTTVMRLSLDTSTGEYTAYNSSMGETASYFAINGFKSENNFYDALIKMDPQNYRKDVIMNNYPMPDLINLDDKANSLLLSNGKTAIDDKDNEAFQTLWERGKAYAYMLYEQSIGGISSPPPYNPDNYRSYTNAQDVKSEITKTMHIMVSQDSENNQIVDYKLEYHCNWPDEVDCSVEYPFPAVKYQGAVQNIYLFYHSSLFYQGNEHPSNPDIIKLESQNLSDTVNFYAVKQSTDPLNCPDVTIERNSDSDHIVTYTNMLDSLGNPYVKMMIGGFEKTGETINRIVAAEKKDRIYDVTIQICEHNDGELKDKYKNVLYTLQATREQ